MSHLTTSNSSRRIAPKRLGLVLGTVAAAALSLGLTACNPAPGHGTVKVTGNYTGDARGPKVTCSQNGELGLVRWSNKLNGNVAALSVHSGVEGDLDGIELVVAGKRYQALGHDLRRVDPYGVTHIDLTLTEPTGAAKKKVRVVAALRCPE